MQNYEDKIKYLAKNTQLSNAQIAEKLGCSKRTVRRYAGPYAQRLKKIFGIEEKDLKQENARILLFDIETAPMEVYVWSLWKNNYISPDSVIKDWSVLCWSAKWLFDDEVMSAIVSPQEAIERSDRSLLQPLWDLLDKADIVVAHNGAKFDVRKMNARFALAGMKPPMPYRIVDTLKVARRQFDLSSYKLDYVNQLFGLEQKTDTNFKLWKRCVTGEKEALFELSNYCDNDVRILEELYVKLRPWIKGHPNVALYIDTDTERCTNCGNTDLDWRGKYFTPAGRYLAFRCNACGAVGRSRFSDLTPEEREKLCLSVAN